MTAEPLGAPTFYANAVPVYVNGGDYAEFADSVCALLRRLAREAAPGEALTAPSLALPAQGEVAPATGRPPGPKAGRRPDFEYSTI